MTWAKALLLALFFNTLTSCQKNEPRELDLLLTGANVVDVENDTILTGLSVGIRNDTIRFVRELAPGDLPRSKRVIDLKGKYLMPGLWDNHVHFRGGDTLIGENKDLLKLFLAYGITTVRDAGGDINLSVLQWRKQIQDGILMGPRIFTSGPKLDGLKPAWPGSISIDSEGDVVNALDSLQSLDVDFVKFYDGSLKAELFYATIEEAEKRKLKTTGHMPMSASIEKAAKLGLDGSEHMYYVLKSCSPLADSLTALDLGYGMIPEIERTYDPEVAQSLFSELSEEGMFVTPTLFISKTLSEILDTDHEQDSLRKFIGEGIQSTYQRRIDNARKARERGSDMRSKVLKRGMQMIRAMSDSGMTILAGSDCGAFNSFVYPGESLHGELRMLEQSGLSPAEALKASVINGPAFFGLQDYYGSVSSGKVGDLIVLEENPLSATKNLQTMSWLIRKSNAFSRSELVDDLK